MQFTSISGCSGFLCLIVLCVCIARKGKLIQMIPNLHVTVHVVLSTFNIIWHLSERALMCCRQVTLSQLASTKQQLHQWQHGNKFNIIRLNDALQRILGGVWGFFYTVFLSNKFLFLMSRFLLVCSNYMRNSLSDIFNSYFCNCNVCIIHNFR